MVDEQQDRPLAECRQVGWGGGGGKALLNLIMDRVVHYEDIQVRVETRF